MKFFRILKDKFLDALYPQNIKCVLCDNELSDSSPLCKDCLKENYFNDGNKCQICDLQIKDGNIICDHCKMRKPKFKRAFCPFVYRGNVRKSILNFKSNGAKYLAKPFAKFMYEKICQSNINFDLIVPVPSHKSTIKKRSYNPTVLLANELSVLLNVPVKEVLIKNVKTKPQKSLNFNERQENLIDSMTITNKDEIKDKVILLIDDIMTTGATINYCCTLLSSAKEIYVSTIARNEIKN